MNTAPAAAAPIEFDGLVKRFGKRTVLNGLSFHVPAGSVVGLLGPNGAGKSTAMIRVAAKGLSMNDASVREILHRVGLADRADDPLGSFSLGMRQRVGIALALVGDPAIVVLDEPTNGLDPEGAVEVRDLVRELPERGATTLLCTHRLAEVEATCDYVVLLQKGKLVTQGTLRDVIAAASPGGLVIDVAPEALDAARGIVAGLGLGLGLGLGEVRVDQGTIITTVTPEDSSLVTHRLADAGIYLRGLSAKRASLEEAFLALTRREEQS